MSWIKENKFAASILGASVVASGALFYIGMSARGDATQANQDNTAAIRKVNRLKDGEPYPDADNKKMVREKVAEFAADTHAFQQEMLKFRPEKMSNVSPGDFNKKVGEYVKLLKAYYNDKKITLPQGVSFGLEAYDGKLADKSATRELEYERKALEWLFKSLADTNPVELKNVHRQKIEAELNAGKKKKSNSKVRNNTVKSVYQAMPIELTFSGSEQSLQAFLATLANSKEYFFAVRVMRIANENAGSPDLSLAQFEEATPPSAFGDASGQEFVFPEGESEEETGEVGGGDDFGSVIAEEEKIIKKVVGDEKVIVYLKLDLLLFNEADQVKIPGFKPAKTETKETKK